jgi:hypothetical protein
MLPKVWSYEDVTKQKCVFRGYVHKIVGRTYEDIPCGEVRTNRADAMKDAKAMIKKLKNIK